jgi:hypothetical protein
MCYFNLIHSFGMIFHGLLQLLEYFKEKGFFWSSDSFQLSDKVDSHCRVRLLPTKKVELIVSSQEPLNKQLRRIDPSLRLFMVRWHPDSSPSHSHLRLLPHLPRPDPRASLRSPLPLSAAPRHTTPKSLLSNPYHDTKYNFVLGHTRLTRCTPRVLH